MNKRDDTLNDDPWDPLVEDDGNPSTVPRVAKPAERASKSRDPDPQQASAVVDAHAANLKNITGAAYLSGSLQGLLGLEISTDAFVRYRDQLLKDCGSPTDPIMIMLIEQLALASHNAGRLHVLSACAKSVQEASAYTAAAARLMAEFRRGALALEELRARAATKANSTNKPSGMNGHDRVNGHAKQGSPLPQPAAKKNGVPSKLTSNNEMPQCIKDRLRPPIPDELQLAGLTG